MNSNQNSIHNEDSRGQKQRSTDHAKKTTTAGYLKRQSERISPNQQVVVVPVNMVNKVSTKYQQNMQSFYQQEKAKVMSNLYYNRASNSALGMNADSTSSMPKLEVSTGVLS